MNDNQIKTFIQTAELGSFSKAAEKLYISPSAVIKQVNTLERDTDIVLFDRTPRGLVLTKAGESFYRDAKYMTQYMEEALLRAKRIREQDGSVIRIGTSLMTPSQFIVKLWPQIHEQYPDVNFQLIPFDNTPENAVHILKNLGEQIDIVAGVFDDAFLQDRGCAAMELERTPIRLAVPIKHPLAQQDTIKVSELCGQKLMLIRRGWNSYVDLLRDYIWKNQPQVTIVDFDFYNVHVFNRCERENSLLMIINNWGDVHPLLKVVSVEWDFSIPFGILHSPTPSKPVKNLLDAVARVYRDSAE